MAVAVDAGGCRDQWEGGGSLCVQALLAQGLKSIPRRRLLKAGLEVVHSPLLMGKGTEGGETVVADGVGGYYCFGERERAMFGQKTFTRRLNGTSHVKDSCVDGSLCELVKGLISDG
jgi:hypothetical protein